MPGLLIKRSASMGNLIQFWESCPRDLNFPTKLTSGCRWALFTPSPVGRSETIIPDCSDWRVSNRESLSKRREPIWMLSLFAWNNNTRNPTRPGVSRSTDYWTTKLETSAAHFGFSSGLSVLCWLLLAPTSPTFCSRALRPARKKWPCAQHWEQADGESRDKCLQCCAPGHFLLPGRHPRVQKVGRQ